MLGTRWEAAFAGTFFHQRLPLRGRRGMAVSVKLIKLMY